MVTQILGNHCLRLKVNPQPRRWTVRVPSLVAKRSARSGASNGRMKVGGLKDP